MSAKEVRKEIKVEEKKMLMDIVESSIDKFGIVNLVDAISEVCIEKSQHLSSNWQDEDAGEAWNRISELLGLSNEKIAQIIQEQF